MKTIVILFVAGFSFATTAQQLPHTTSYVEKYPEKADHALYIPGTFSRESLPAGFADQLSEKTIRRIDLVYTRFKASPSFDQKALNEARTQQLTSFYPGIVSQVKEINWVEQTGAVKRSEAAGYFHGFVVYYSDPEPSIAKEVAPKMSLRDYFNDSGNQGTTYTINNERDTTLYFESGSILRIPAHSVAKPNQSTVYGSYSIVYKEYRNPAEIVLSGIPMTYEKNAVDYNFNSAGMLEIRGYQDGEELKLIKPLTIDFNCTEQLPELSYYQLDDRTNKWKELRKIDWAKAAVPVNNRKQQKRDKIRPRSVDNRTTGSIKHGFFYRLTHWKTYRTSKRNSRMVTDNFDPNATLLAEGANTGHTYPTQVRGLNCSSFGVYNCDQIFRTGNPIAFNPTYLNQSTGKAIEKPFVACLIDRKVNGSFSFDPAQVMCNPESKNILLLFTEDEKVFALDSDDFAQLNLKAQNVQVSMKEITKEAQTSDDLKKYLNL